MKVINLSAAELDEIAQTLRAAIQDFSSIEDPSFIPQAARFSASIPQRLREEIESFRSLETEAALLIRGLPIDDDGIGATPATWERRETPAEALKSEAFTVLCSMLLGDPISWEEQQNGRYIHDILPIRAHEGIQVSSSSDSTLTWHTEDASQSNFADYLLLMCLRNPRRTVTRVSSIDRLQLDTITLEILFHAKFVMRRDMASRGGPDGAKDGGEEAIEATVLFGSPAKPYIKLDSYYIDPQSAGPNAESALHRLLEKLDEGGIDIPLDAGDLLIIDNLRAVHGREPFSALYDGTDRWLKRMSVHRGRRQACN